MIAPINTIGAPGFAPFPGSSAVGGGYRCPTNAAPALIAFDSAGDCTPRAVTSSDLNTSNKAADNIANALNSSRPFVSVLHANKHGEYKCAKTRPGWTGK